MTDFDWNHIRSFLATVEAGSLSGAARKLGLTQPTLSRQIAALELDLGLPLFDRVGKRLHLTAAGTQLAVHVREMGLAADRLGLAATGQSTTVEGIVRITAIDAFAAYLIPSILNHLRETAPGIVLEVIASNTIDDLLRREADIAIRHTEPTHPDLIARRCPDSEIGLYAASSLLDRVGRPTPPHEVAAIPFIGFPENEQLIAEYAARGYHLSLDTIRWRCARSLINWELIKDGHGVGIMFREVVREEDGVEEVLPDMAPLVAPMWLVVHRDLQTSRRIRPVFDALFEQLSRRNRRLTNLRSR